MSNYCHTKTEIRHYLMARTPLVIIHSAERERVERMLGELAGEMAVDIWFYTDARQIVNLAKPFERQETEDIAEFIAGHFRKRRNAIFALGDVRRIGDDNSHTRDLLSILYLAKENDNTLILVTPDNVWPRLAQFGMMTTLDHPDVDESTGQINSFIVKYKGRFAIDWEAEDVRRAATLLRGFTEIQIDNILSSSIIANQGLLKARIYQLTGQKSRMYAAVSSVQEVKVDYELQVSGLEGLKRWLKEQKTIFFASDEQLKRRDLRPPKGVLLAGIPGCGKSFSAKMIAKEWELPLFRFDIGAVYDKWVGESEKKMRDALQFVDNVSPCVLWIDEIEKALSTADAGNDTGKRVLGQFLFWLQESGGRVFLVATANDITLLPIELFRKGRFSEVFFIDLPDRRERGAAIAQYVKKSLHCRVGEAGLRELVDASEGFSYSDIEYAIKDVAQMALSGDPEIITEALLAERFRAVVPFGRSHPEMVEKLRQWGRERAVTASDNVREG